MTDDCALLGFFVDFIDTDQAAVATDKPGLARTGVARCQIDQFPDHVVRTLADITGLGVIGGVDDQGGDLQQVTQNLDAVGLAAARGTGDEGVLFPEAFDGCLVWMVAQIFDHREMVGRGDGKPLFVFFLADDVFVEVVFDLFGSEGPGHRGGTGPEPIELFCQTRTIGLVGPVLCVQEGLSGFFFGATIFGYDLFDRFFGYRYLHGHLSFRHQMGTSAHFGLIPKLDYESACNLSISPSRWHIISKLHAISLIFSDHNRLFYVIRRPCVPPLRCQHLYQGVKFREEPATLAETGDRVGVTFRSRRSPESLERAPLPTTSWRLWRRWVDIDVGMAFDRLYSCKRNLGC